MGKIVKYCAVCEEGFAQKFSFCPICSSKLTAYEMNPVKADLETKDLLKSETIATKPDPNPSVFQQANVSFADEKREVKKIGNDFYNVTFVEEKSSKTRRLLLISAALIVMSGAFFSLIASIYNADAYVGALDDSLSYIAAISNNDPTQIEDLELPENKDEKEGSGGSGGNKDRNPVSRGELASQSEKPLIAPTITNVRVTNPEIRIQMETRGVVKRKITDQPYGDPTSDFNIESDGPGEKGGQGTGSERGQGTRPGDGSGPSEGPGIGIGPGGLRKNISEREPIEKDDPPLIPKGVTTAMKIISKPRAIYTDAARRNQIAGTVTLRVTFLANGSIGTITPISGLSDGLTEQAIAAARNIQFEPAKKNGLAQTVSKQVQYTFTLY